MKYYEKRNSISERILDRMTVKDAYKNLSAERRRQAINEKLKDLFGI